MPAVSQDEAVDLLTKEVEERLGPDDLLEVYSELFPDCPPAPNGVRNGRTTLVDRIVAYLKGRAVEEIVELWGLIIPKHRGVWYDEEEQRIHYRDEAEPVTSD